MVSRILYYSLVTQTNKPFYGLAMNIRGVPKDGTKKWSPYKIQKVYSQKESKIVKPFVVTGSKNGVVKTLVSSFL